MRVRTEFRRQAILDAATRLFREMGYERASMNELAKRCGGSKATIYGYFPSKESLFVEVVKASATAHLSEATKELVGDVRGTEALESKLLRFAERMLLVVTNDATSIEVYRMVVAEAGRTEVGELFRGAGPRQANEALSRVLSGAMKVGILRKANPNVAASQFTSLVVAETSARVLERDPKPMTPSEIRKIAQRAVDMFLHGMGPPRL